MLNVECYSTRQFFGLPNQHKKFDEDDRNTSVFAIETQSENESAYDRSVLKMQMDIQYAAISFISPATFKRLSKHE